MDKENCIASAISAFEAKSHELTIFMNNISQWFGSHPGLNTPAQPLIHSVKSRIKDKEHLREKINRKWNDENPIDGDCIFQKITDLTGVRVLHLYQEQFPAIHKAILAKVEEKDWYLHEAPKAYTWDPETTKFYNDLQIGVEVKESFYTSVHYLLRPRRDSPLCCELQVRTLFEEIWGEVEHSLNYPVQNPNVACREQLLVLAKLVGAGSRLVDAIYRSAIN